jgi:glycosyltransferase involved in cell wall biosynthesis
MNGRIVLLGKKKNPYPYMYACDMYVQPSRYEGKAVTVREAQILGKPIAITNFPTSKSQLTDMFDGVIIPMDNDGAAKGLADFIDNNELQSELIKNLQTSDYGNESEIEKLYALIDK